jgi:putative lipoic acid-binding regulatory protein
MAEEKAVLKFPCRFPIKVMGDSYAEIDIVVKKTLEEHLSNREGLELKTRLSKAGNYVSITAIFTAESQAELDRIYTILSQHEKIKYVL